MEESKLLLKGIEENSDLEDERNPIAAQKKHPFRLPITHIVLDIFLLIIITILATIQLSGTSGHDRLSFPQSPIPSCRYSELSKEIFEYSSLTSGPAVPQTTVLWMNDSTFVPPKIFTDQGVLSKALHNWLVKLDPREYTFRYLEATRILIDYQ